MHLSKYQNLNINLEGLALLLVPFPSGSYTISAFFVQGSLSFVGRDLLCSLWWPQTMKLSIHPSLPEYHTWLTKQHFKEKRSYIGKEPWVPGRRYRQPPKLSLISGKSETDRTLAMSWGPPCPLCAWLLRAQEVEWAWLEVGLLIPQ